MRAFVIAMTMAVPIWGVIFGIPGLLVQVTGLLILLYKCLN